MYTIQVNDSDGSYVIFGNPKYPPTPKPGYTIQEVAVLPVTLAQAKKTKLASLLAVFARPVEVAGITLAVDADTVNQMNHLVTLLNLARDQQPDDTHRAAFLATEVSTVTGPILDAAGHGHDLPVSQVFGLVLAYGQAFGAARGAYLAGIAAVNAATTVAAVQAV